MRSSWKWIFVCLGTLACTTIAIGVKAQVVYEWAQDPIVKFEGNELQNPWSGGLNSPQFSNLDLDQDGIDDLVVFDRTNDKIYTYLIKDGKQIYAPQYENLFPGDIEGWMLLRDFNCDGLNDLFAHTNLGIKVYQNTSSSQGQGQLSWLLVADPILTVGSSGSINLQVNVLDLPAIVDIDLDGDLDILTYDFAVGGGIEFHKNQSIEETGSCGIKFERVTKRWGGFEECECDSFAFGDEECIDISSRIKHIGGKTLLTLDIDGDGDQEAIIGQEDCLEIAFLENRGDADNALMEEFTSQFPSNNPIDSYTYPSTFLVDVDGDQSNELIGSTNFAFNRRNEIDFAESVSMYSSINSASGLEFELESSSFLQSQTIDLGEEASPAFADYDKDGDQDLFISHKGRPGVDRLIGSVWLYRNTGTSASPSFEFVTDDYADISTLELSHIKIQFVDLDLDGNKDLLLSGSSEGNEADIYSLSNQSNSVFSFDINTREPLGIEDLGAEDHFHFTFINSENQADLLVGKSQGALELHSNNGSPTSPAFNLSNESYLGIENDFNRKNLAIATGFFDQDEQLDLLITNETGDLTVYSSFLSNSPDIQPLQLALDANSIPSAYQIGNRANLTSGSIFSDSQSAIVIGLKTGGVQIIRPSDATPITPGEGEKLSMITFPNPTLSTDLITIVVNKNAVIEVLNPSGQLLLSGVHAIAGTSIRLRTGLFKQGLYLIKARSDSGEIVTNRVVFY